jgi:hypothetical protein
MDPGRPSGVPTRTALPTGALLPGRLLDGSNFDQVRPVAELLREVVAKLGFRLEEAERHTFVLMSRAVERIDGDEAARHISGALLKRRLLSLGVFGESEQVGPSSVAEQVKRHGDATLQHLKGLLTYGRDSRGGPVSRLRRPRRSSREHVRESGRERCSACRGGSRLRRDSSSRLGSPCVVGWARS